jgi:thioredoxin reductase (NADPH)
MEISGFELVEKMRKQVEASGASFLQAEVVGVDFRTRPFKITVRGFDGKGERQIVSETCIIAMGTEPNFLGVPGEAGEGGYWGRGVSNCATCDGPLYRGKTVGVVGGGDAAVLEALYLSEIAKEVHLYVRKDALKATEQKRVQTLLERPNVKVVFNTEVTSIEGDGEQVTAVTVKDLEGSRKVALDGLFLGIGSKPNSEIFKGALDLDNKGYIALKKDQETSIEGVYAIGDISDPVYKQAISASGDGAKAALAAQQFVSDRTYRLAKKSKKAKPSEIESALVSSVIEITSAAEFEKELKGEGRLVIVDFYASWCGPCKVLSPHLDSAAGKLSGKAKFLKVNVDKLSEISSAYGVRAMPTVIVFDSSGKIVDRKVGSDQILDLLKQLEK